MGIEKKENKTGISYDAYVYLPINLQVIYNKKRIHKTFLSIKEAQKWEKDRKKEISQGFIRLNDEITIEELAKKYIESNKLSLSPNTIKSFTGFIKNYYVYVFKDKSLNKLTCLDLKKFNSYLEQLKKSEKTKHNIATGLRSLLKWAVENNYVEEELISYIGKFSQKPVREKDFLNKQELEIMLSYIEDSFLYDIIAFLSFSGFRISELCGLRFCDVDFENHIVTIKNQIFHSKEFENGYILKNPKCNNISSVPIIDIAYDILIKIKKVRKPKPSDFVFVNYDNKPFRKDGYIKCQFDKIVLRLKNMILTHL